MLPSSGLTLAGSIVGLIPGFGLSILRTVNHPTGWELVPGNTVFGLIYKSPYLLAIYDSRLQSISSRAPLLLAAATLSFIISFSAVSGIHTPVTSNPYACNASNYVANDRSAALVTYVEGLR